MVNSKLSVIIINWNAATDTIRCVRELMSWQHLQPTIWVVDNASSDDSADIITRDYPRVHLIRNSTNQGFSGGNNRGLEKALAYSDAPILLLNNDAVVAEADAIHMLETLENNLQIGIVGPLLFDAEQKDKLLTAGGQNMVFHLKSHISAVNTAGPVQIVDYIPGTVMLARTEVFREVGLMDEAYFFNGETPDLCQRAKQQGYLSAVDNRAKAFHAVERSSIFRDTLYSYYIIRNRFLFIRKFYHLLKFPLCSFWTLYSLALFLKLWSAGKLCAARAVSLGLQDGLCGRFGRQNERVLAVCANSSVLES